MLPALPSFFAEGYAAVMAALQQRLLRDRIAKELPASFAIGSGKPSGPYSSVPPPSCPIKWLYPIRP